VPTAGPECPYRNVYVWAHTEVLSRLLAEEYLAVSSVLRLFIGRCSWILGLSLKIVTLPFTESA
jgi:hypothetical protein